MKPIVQILFFNEEVTLPQTARAFRTAVAEMHEIGYGKGYLPMWLAANGCKVRNCDFRVIQQKLFLLFPPTGFCVV